MDSCAERVNTSAAACRLRLKNQKARFNAGPFCLHCFAFPDAIFRQRWPAVRAYERRARCYIEFSLISFPLSGSTASTSEALLVGFTLVHVFTTLPLGLMRKVLRLAMKTPLWLASDP